jgi:hypothetical protein
VNIEARRQGVNPQAHHRRYGLHLLTGDGDYLARWFSGRDLERWLLDEGIAKSLFR